jgi:pimeloyl-ACP methyl ester carboxylesterase
MAQHIERHNQIKSPDGGKVGYRLTSLQQSKPLITLLHGLASNCTRFSEFIEYTKLKNTWDLLRMDLRGHGESMYRKQYSRETWLKDLLLVLQQERYQQSVFMGHSLGAQVAIEFSYKHPNKSRGLILIDPVFPEHLQGRLGKAKRYRFILTIIRTFLRLANTIGLRRWKIPKRDLRALDEQTRKTLEENPELKIADLYTNPFEDFKYIPLVNYLQDINEVIKPLPPLEEIKIPVLVLLSGGATVSSFDKTKQTINKFPNAKIEVVDADHWLLTEKPDETREIIERWCDETYNHKNA